MFSLFAKREVADDDEDLIADALSGRAEAFGTLYKKYVDDVYRFVYFRVRTAQEAEDLTQECFLKVYTKLKSYRSGSFVAWLYTIARNTVIDYWRKKGKTKQVELIEEAIVEDGEDVIAAIDMRDTIAATKQALGELKDNYSEVIRLRYISDLSVSETATAMEQSENWVRVTSCRAIKQLKALLEKKNKKLGVVKNRK